MLMIEDSSMRVCRADDYDRRYARYRQEALFGPLSRACGKIECWLRAIVCTPTGGSSGADGHELAILFLQTGGSAGARIADDGTNEGIFVYVAPCAQPPH